MKILFVGDVYGEAGRAAIKKHLPSLKKRYAPDITIVNGENAAHGIGITPKICEAFNEQGADVITTGNHVWDQREIIPYIKKDINLLRPINYPEGTPGNGSVIFKTKTGFRVMVINVMCRLFMDPLDDPFRALEEALDKEGLAQTVDAIFIDVHGEATSEKMAIGHYFDGRVTGVIGTHTHIPTADAHVLANGTAYMSDAGMTGVYDSVIGVQKDLAIARFFKTVPGKRFQPAKGEAMLCGALIEVDDKTGLAKSIKAVRIGHGLEEALP